MLTQEQYKALKELRDSIYPYTKVQSLRDGRKVLDELIEEYEHKKNKNEKDNESWIKRSMNNI